MTRDRLADLKEARGDCDSKNLYDEAITVDFKDEFMADFFAQAEDIQDSIDKIKRNVEEVKKKHKSILCTPGTEENEKQELEDLLADIKKMANQVRIKIKALEFNNEQHQQKSGSSASMRIRSTQCSALLRTFVEVMTDYNQAQLDYREQNKDRIRRHLEITGRSTTDEELEGLLESGNVAVFTQGIIMDMQQAKQTVALIEARHSDILKLEKNIRELHDMFMDVAMLVENQGEMIDRIEYHVQNATGYTDNAVVQTRQASSYKVKARKKKIVIIICLGVVVGLLVLVIVLAWKLK